VDLTVAGVLLAAVAALELVLNATVTRPLWYDELWRAHFLSVPAGSFWNQLRYANSPSAAGWLALERAVAAIGGWHAWVLRLPEVATLPLLAAGTYLLGRRFLGPVPAAVAAVVVGLGGTTIDLGIQLKPYSVEAVVTLPVVALWIIAPVSGTGRTASRVRRLTATGVLSLMTVPLTFLLVPLAAIDVATTPGGRRARARAAAETAPALALSVLHSVWFVARQSGQRDGSFWDAQFLAGRGLGGGVAFIGRQVWRVAGGLPTGIDRIDPNLVHSPTDATWVSGWLIAPAVIAAWVLGGRALRHSRDGRLLVGGLAGAELVELVASGDRFWPFGAARPNLFLVPLLVLVAAVGAVELGRLAGRAGSTRMVGALGLAAAALLVTGTAATTMRLWDLRAGVRLESRLVDATLTARSFARPGDIAVVGGRLARTGWSYAMDASADGPSPGAAVPAGATRTRRIPPSDTVYLTAVGQGQSVRALAARGIWPRRPVGRRVLLFILLGDQSSRDGRGGEAAEIADLAGAGWCPVLPARTFADTGQLTILSACGTAPRPHSPDTRRA
jgi:hypothetical protein